MELHVLDLIPAYALNCLDEADRYSVAEHLSQCQACQAELRVYQEVVGQLAGAVPQVNPRDELKAEVMGRIGQRSLAGARDHRIPWIARLAAWISKPSAWAYMGAAVILALVISNLLLWNQTRAFHAVAQPTAFSVVNLSGSEVSPEAKGVLVISQDGEYGTLVAEGLPILDEDQQYQLWLIRDGTRTDGGVFSVNQGGYGSLWVYSPRPLADYTAFGVTIEPAGGSPGPTGVKVLGSDT